MCAQGAQGSSCGQSLRQCRMVVQAGEAEGGRCTTRPEKRGRIVKRVLTSVQQAMRQILGCTQGADRFRSLRRKPGWGATHCCILQGVEHGSLHVVLHRF